jgi:hypothetical protein
MIDSLEGKLNLLERSGGERGDKDGKGMKKKT